MKKRNKATLRRFDVDGKQPVGDAVAAKIKELQADVVMVLGREGHVLSLMEKLKDIQYTGVTVLAANGAKTSRASSSWSNPTPA